jgi:transcriptional regulator with XRE-family HTH domain
MAQEAITALAQLERDLKRVFRAKLATQEECAIALGLTQSTVSKAKRGTLKRETAGTRALQKYADMLLRAPELSPRVQDAAKGFLSAGGSEAELIEAITLSTRLVRGRRAA